MDREQLEALCADRIAGTEFEGLDVLWCYPGVLVLSPKEAIETEGQGTVEVIASPDFTNGEPGAVVFGIHWGGQYVPLGGPVWLEWSECPDRAACQYREVVESRMPRIREALDVCRQGWESFLRYARTQRNGVLISD
jgi:hypothetical protein